MSMQIDKNVLKDSPVFEGADMIPITVIIDSGLSDR